MGATGACIDDCPNILSGSSLGPADTCTCPANRIDNGAGACTQRMTAPPPNDRDKDRRSSDRGGGGDGLGALAASAAAAALFRQSVLDDFWASLSAPRTLCVCGGTKSLALSCSPFAPKANLFGQDIFRKPSVMEAQFGDGQLLCPAHLSFLSRPFQWPQASQPLSFSLSYYKVFNSRIFIYLSRSFSQ